ncbi:MAG TPA: MarR family transcriptional regulator [Pseudolysinimonas sp.]|nr:MarR family transcriptional regulator [Pseudolysinimonas sp.]
MAQVGPSQHLLDGFPHASLHFFRALEANRRNAAARFGLSEMELRALFRIAEAGNITPKALASDLLVTTGAVTGVSDRLIGAGLVTRIANPDDRRSLLLELTEVGHETMTQMHRDFISMLIDAADVIDLAELEAAATTLHSIADRVEGRIR